MPAVNEEKPTTQQQAVIDEIAKYIDTLVLALALVEEMKDADVPITFENARGIYLAFLTDLHLNIREAIGSRDF